MPLDIVGILSGLLAFSLTFYWGFSFMGKTDYYIARREHRLVYFAMMISLVSSSIFIIHPLFQIDIFEYLGGKNGTFGVLKGMLIPFPIGFCMILLGFSLGALIRNIFRSA